MRLWIFLHLFINVFDKLLKDVQYVGGGTSRFKQEPRNNGFV